MQSDNEAARARAARLLDEGAIFAFGLSEQAHGADIYSTDMVLTRRPEVEGGFRANGAKYYIGNGNEAGMVSVFGRRDDIEGPDGYVFFAADSAAPELRAGQERRQLAELRLQLRARRLPGRARGHPPHRAARPSTPR